MRRRFRSTSVVLGGLGGLFDAPVPQQPFSQPPGTTGTLGFGQPQGSSSLNLFGGSAGGGAMGTGGGGGGSVFESVAKILAGGITGASQYNTAQTQQQMYLMQQQAQARQTQMMVIIGVIGLGAFLLLGRN